MKVRDLLEIQAQKYPNKSAISFGETKISFTEVRDSSFKIANYLNTCGIVKGDKVALYLSNTPETIFNILGVFSQGAVVVPLDFMLIQEEVITFINHSESKLLIAQPRKGIDFNQIKSACPNLKEIIICKEKQEGFSFLAESLSQVDSLEPKTEVSDSDLAAIFYTSGSTGHPKGVMINCKQLDNPAYVINHFLQITEKDSFLCGGVPFSHVGGLVYILLTIAFACELVLMERFHPLEFLKSIEKYKVTVFCIVPAMFMAILSLKEYGNLNLSSLRYAAVFGAPSSPAILKRFHAAYPNAKLTNGWGMTETAAPNTLSEPGDEKVRSIGKFAPNVKVKVMDRDQKECQQGEKGELWIKGEAIMPGYYKEPELTDQVLTADGWLKTGDVAYCDNQGFYYICGRIKDMIKVAGEIVFSAEVEEKIQRHPKVREVAVIGVSDNLRGEVPKAFVVVSEEESFNESELKEFLKEKLAHFKIPRYFSCVKELPKNRTGKIDKTKLS